MPLYDYRIAAGTNIALGSLINIEDIFAFERFAAPRSPGLFDPGEAQIRAGGGVYFNGFALTTWRWDYLHSAQYEYLRDTLLTGRYSGAVTIYTRLDTNTYVRRNAIMVLPEPNSLQWNGTRYNGVDVLMTRLRIPT